MIAAVVSYEQVSALAPSGDDDGMTSDPLGERTAVISRLSWQSVVSPRVQAIRAALAMVTGWADSRLSATRQPRRCRAESISEPEILD
jgi:hypothetical protein